MFFDKKFIKLPIFFSSFFYLTLWEVQKLFIGLIACFLNWVQRGTFWGIGRKPHKRLETPPKILVIHDSFAIALLIEDNESHNSSTIWLVQAPFPLTHSHLHSSYCSPLLLLLLFLLAQATPPPPLLNLDPKGIPTFFMHGQKLPKYLGHKPISTAAYFWKIFFTCFYLTVPSLLKYWSVWVWNSSLWHTLNRKACLMRFVHLATVTGKSSTLELNVFPAVKELGLHAISYMRTQPLFHSRHSPTVVSQGG